MKLLFVHFAAALALLSAPPLRAQTSGPAAPEIRDVASPAQGDAAFPALASDGQGGVFMTWLETLPAGAGHRLRLAHRKPGGVFGDPMTVHEGRDFWRNWADFPGLGVFADGAVIVHWLSRSGDSTYDYDIRATISRDGGRTWGAPFLVNTDGIKAEHGFVAFAPTAKGIALTWLDGRATKGSHEGDHAAMGGGAMTLRFAEFSSDGTRLRESLLDAKVCDCCQTAIVDTPKGLLAAYRDRSDDEVRDISVVRPLAARPEPRPLARDGWKIKACPVNGPALASRGDAVAAAWFTMAGGGAHVRAAVSKDAGDTFSAPIEIDQAAPLGRVDVALLPSGASLLTWVVRVAEGVAEIRATTLDASGAPGPPFKVATTSVSRASGFPRMEVSGDEVVIAWTEVGPAPTEGAAPSTVRTATIRIR
jgi:hypothetical protein